LIIKKSKFPVIIYPGRLAASINIIPNGVQNSSPNKDEQAVNLGTKA